MKEWKIYTSLPKLTSQNPIHTIPDCTVIQIQQESGAVATGSLSYWVWCYVVELFMLHLKLYQKPSHKIQILPGEVPPVHHSWCALHTSSVPTSFKLLPWDQLKIASYRSVTQPQKVMPCVLITYKGLNRKAAGGSI